MTFVPPFFDANEAVIDADTNNNISIVKEPRGSTAATTCVTPQTTLDTCFATNACDDGCDLWLGDTMAADCSAVLMWTCVLERKCPPCTVEITDLLECVGVVGNCGFDECSDQPLPPALIGYANVPPSAVNSVAPAIMESSPVSSPIAIVGEEDTSMPTNTQGETANTFSPSYLTGLEVPFTNDADTSASVKSGVCESLVFALLAAVLLAFR